MHDRDFFYNNYKNHPEAVLQRISGDYDKLTPQAQEALRDVLKEKNLEALLPVSKAQTQKKNDLSHLTADEVRVLINQRLEKGESAERINADLRDRGVNIYEMSLQESRSEENIDRRFMELRKEGKSKSEIDAKLKEEFKMSTEQAAKVPERMRSTGAGMIGAGLLLLLISVPLLAVTVQSPGHYDIKLPLIGVGAGIGCLIIGIRKRTAAAKFIRETEKNS